LRIVVVGAGKLGYSVAQLLANDQYDVVVIEQDEKRREVVKNNLDVLTVGANGASPLTMAETFVKDADMLLASTDSDEANMVICMLAKQNGVKHTVARIRNTDYTQLSDVFMKDDMKVDMILNPEQITAKEINRILMTPAALNVEDFADGRVRMFEVKLRSASKMIDVPLKDLDIPKQVLVAMIFRNNRMIIPHGDDVMRDNDNVFLLAEET